MNSVSYPDGAAKYILYQRTGILKTTPIPKIFTELCHTRNMAISINSVLYKKKIYEEYTRIMRTEYDRIKDALPSKSESILDIGCGLALIDVFLYEHYGGLADIFLLDKTFIAHTVYYGYKPTGCYYNSLSFSREMLVNNGVSSDKIHCQEATPDNKINFLAKHDLIISLASWGFHYPVSTYLERAHKILNEGGVLIIDVRRDTDGIMAIRQKFGNCTTIYTRPKYSRVKAVK